MGVVAWMGIAPAAGAVDGARGGEIGGRGRPNAWAR
jgi:hypothetical protein